MARPVWTVKTPGKSSRLNHPIYVEPKSPPHPPLSTNSHLKVGSVALEFARVHKVLDPLKPPDVHRVDEYLRQCVCAGVRVYGVRVCVGGVGLYGGDVWGYMRVCVCGNMGMSICICVGCG